MQTVDFLCLKNAADYKFPKVQTPAFCMIFAPNQRSSEIAFDRPIIISFRPQARPAT